MIRTFADTATERLWRTGKGRKLPPNLRRRAIRKLALLDAATRLEDLASPPGNRLELLKGDRKGQHSIRINDQFRICFRWENGDANDVEVADYH
ncbi:MAG TPA: type II toxin-antitoxin system RelE/ParE family toxin [Candidatus Angelobacter sp.]